MNQPTEIIQNCETCAHMRKEYGSLVCAKFGNSYCSSTVTMRCLYKYWQPIPGRRSLRQWLYDTFLK
jgi:hypothetical protein